MSTPTAIQGTTIDQLQRLVSRIAVHGPEFAARAEKAVLIIMAGKLNPLGGDTFEVVGCEPAPYVVDALAETCECKDFARRAPEYKGAGSCKHLLATLLYRHLSTRGERRSRGRLARVATFRPGVARRPVRRAA